MLGYQFDDEPNLYHAWKKGWFQSPFSIHSKKNGWNLGFQVMYTLPETINFPPEYRQGPHPKFGHSSEPTIDVSGAKMWRFSSPWIPDTTQERGDLGAARALGKSGESTSASARFWTLKGARGWGPVGESKFLYITRWDPPLEATKKQLLVAFASQTEMFWDYFCTYFLKFVVRTPLWSNIDLCIW